MGILRGQVKGVTCLDGTTKRFVENADDPALFGERFWIFNGEVLKLRLRNGLPGRAAFFACIQKPIFIGI